MMIVVTNLGSISYLVKKNTYDRNIAVKIYNDAVSMHNQGSNLRDYQKAVSYFLSGCHEANIIYENQQEDDSMLGKAVLSEKKEDNVMAAEWGKKQMELLEKGEEITKRISEKYKTMILARKT